MLGYRCCAARKSIAAIVAFALAASMSPLSAYAVEPDSASDSSVAQAPVPNVQGESTDAQSGSASAQLPDIQMIPQTPDEAASVLAADVREGDMVVQQDGLNFLVGQEGATFTGWSAVAPTGALNVPETVRVGGQDVPVVAMSFSQAAGVVDAVNASTASPTSASAPAADAQAALSVEENAGSVVEISTAAAWLALADKVAACMSAPEVTSIVLPSSLTSIDTTAFAAFPNAKTIMVDAANATYKSYNGMLFNSNLTSLLLVPEGLEGNAVLPLGIASVPAYVFSRCTKLSAIIPTSGEDGSQTLSLSDSQGGMATSAFYFQDGLLYEKNADASGAPDGTLTLVAAPSAVGVSVHLVPECTAIAEGALWGCRDLATIQAPGVISGICTGMVADLEDTSILFSAPASGVAAESTDAAVPSPGASSLAGAEAEPYLYAVAEENADIQGSAQNANPDALTYYAQVPAFRPSVIEAAIVVTADDDQHKQAWEVVGFTQFAQGTALPDFDDSDDTVAEDGSSLPVKPVGPADEDGFAFTMLSNGTLSVAWAADEDAPAQLEIPASGVLDGVSYTVTKIADQAFANDPQIESVTLPLTITEIGDAAFARCSSLRTVALNSGLVYIGEDAFRTTALEGVVIPGGVHYIGSKAFGDLKDTEIVAPAAIPYVSESALSGSTGVHVYVPYNEAGDYVWNTGVVATGNRLCPYGVRLNSQAMNLQSGQSAELFGGDGYIYAPGSVKVSCTYNADAVDINAASGVINALRSGNADVNISLSVPVSETSISRQKHESVKVG